MEKETIKILLIEFDPQNITKIENVFAGQTGVAYEVLLLQKEEKVLNKVDKEDFDVILLSCDLPGSNGIEILSDLQYKDLKGPVIMMANKKDEEFSAQAMRMGAYDFVIRHEDFEKGLPLVMHNALITFRAAKERERLQDEISAKKAELEAANRRLKELDNLKSSFVSNVAHEFRTPLTIIKGNVDMVVKGRLGNVSPEQKDMLDGAINIANRLSRLVNDLLDISKIESGKLQLKKEPVNINEIVEQNIKIFDKILKDKKQILKKELAKKSLVVNADLDKTTQVFVNLLSNAIKYSPESGTIIVRSLDLEKEIMVEVSDTGEGIYLEDIDKIFDKFTRVTAEKKEGTGLGLPIAKDIVELHKGRMWVKSEVGKGSQFYFTLPKSGA